MKKSLLTFLVLLISISSFGQSWLNTGNALQRQTNGTYSNYRFNLGSPGFMYFYNKTQTDSLFNIAVGSGVTSFNGRTGSVTLLSSDVTIALGFTPVPTTRQLLNGYGILGGGTLATDRTITTDTTTIVSKINLASQQTLKTNKSLTLSGGYGVSTIGDLSANRTVTVDTTVVVAKPNLASQMSLKENTANKTSTISNSTVQFPNVKAVQDYVMNSIAIKADTTSVINKSAIQSQYNTVPGLKRIYSKTSYTTVGNLVSNSAFTSGTTGYTPTDLVDGSANNLYSVVTHDGKNWLRLDEATASAGGTAGYMSFTINIPAESRNSVMEISFLVSGYFYSMQVGTESFNSVSVNIDPAKPERIYYYYNPNGASTVTVKLIRSTASQLTAGYYADFTEILAKEATYKLGSIAKGLPSNGGSIQLARWMGVNWNESQQEQILLNYRKTGGFARVWISSDLFALYTTKTAVKRTTVSSTYFSTAYNALTTAKIPTGALDPTKVYYLDWLFKKCQQYGLKIHIVLGAAFPDGNGNPSSTMSTPGTYEFLDSDSQIQSGFTSLYTTVVNRYKNYENIIGWELNNEGFLTWQANYAGVNTSTIPRQQYGNMFAGYKSWERTTYTAIKVADPIRPIILNENNSPQGQYLATDDICDWFCPSFYPGEMFIDLATGVSGALITPNAGFGQILKTFQNGYPLIAHTVTGNTLPSPLVEGTTYYVVGLTTNTFSVASSIGGSALTLSGGSGRISFYSTDGETGVSMGDYILQKLAYQPNFTYLSEVGAAIGSNAELRLYQNPTINASYITAVNKRMQIYGIGTFSIYDEANLLFSPTTGVFTAAGTILTSISPTSFGETIDQSILTNDVTLIGQTKLQNTYLTTSGANGLVIQPDQSSTTQSARQFFSSSSGSNAISRNGSGVLQITTGASPGTATGTPIVGFSSTGLRIGDGAAATALLDVRGVGNFTGNITTVSATTASQVVIKSQLDLKLDINNPTFTGTLTGAAANLSGNLNGTTANFTGNVATTGTFFTSGSASGLIVADRTNSATLWGLYSQSNTIALFGNATSSVFTADYNTQVLSFTQSPIVPSATTSGQAVNKGQLDAAVSGLGSGTVTNVSSTNSDIAVTSPTTTPVLTLNNINGTTKSYYDPTSSIQTQLNSKAPLASPTFTGTVTVPSATNTSSTAAVNQSWVNSFAAILAGTNVYSGSNTFNSSASFNGTTIVPSPSSFLTNEAASAAWVNTNFSLKSDTPIAGSFSGVGTATTTFTVTIGTTQANNTYKVNATPTNVLSAAVFYVTNKTTTTFDVVYLAGLTGTIAFDWSLFR